MNAFEYVSAKELGAAANFLRTAEKGATLVKAGGVDVVDRLKERLAAPKAVLNILPLRPAATISAEDGSTNLHALATLAEIAGHADARSRLAVLAEAAGEAASPQIRNVATLGGNVCQKPRCWYFRGSEFKCLKKGGDLCYAVNGDNRYHAVFGAGACHIVHPSNTAAALLALAAEFVVASAGADGKTALRTIAADEFFRVPADPTMDENTLEPGDLIEHVHVPAASHGPRSAYYDVREKQAFDWPLAACAANLNTADRPRIVLGAVAPIPWRLKKVEELIAGKSIDDALLTQARKLSMEGAKPMTGNGYKVQLVGVVVERALRLAASRK